MEPFLLRVAGMAAAAAGLTVLAGASLTPRALGDPGLQSILLILLMIAAAVALWHRLRR